MTRRIPIAFVAACLISGACTYMLGRKLKLDNSSRERQRVRYVAPARPLDAGAVLKTTDLEWTQWPAENPLPDAVERPDTMVGRVVLYPLAKGQPILERDLAAPGSGGGLGSRIPTGMRALALRSDEVIGVAGFLSPGSHVDVLVTYHSLGSAEEVTATVVQNAEVLAAGQQAEPDPSGKPAIATVVTLLLTPLDSERAFAASTQGTIHFILRNALDHIQVSNERVSLAWMGNAEDRQVSAKDKLAAAFRALPGVRAPRRSRALASSTRSSRIETVFGDADVQGGKERSPEQGLASMKDGSINGVVSGGNQR